MVRFSAILTVATLLVSVEVVDIHGQESHPEIVTSGVGEVVVAPDMAEARVTVETEGSNASEASRLNAEALNAVVTSLGRRGIVPDSLPTVGYVVQPRYEMRNGRRVLSGYSAVATIRLRVWKLDDLGSLIDGALEAGATGVSSLRFDTSRRNEIRRRALQLAVDAAKGDAEVMADAAGGSLGPMVRLTNQMIQGPPIMAERAMMGTMAVADAPQLTPDDVVIRVSVSGIWRFIP
ncbi:MAG: SIMPL domain-containing protein [Gemmatimonadota bacterium]|nr:SIMPL domain-containing protein [Gemmatimonadota bacterium]